MSQYAGLMVVVVAVCVYVCVCVSGIDALRGVVLACCITILMYFIFICFIILFAVLLTYFTILDLLYYIILIK